MKDAVRLGFHPPTAQNIVLSSGRVDDETNKLFDVSILGGKY